MTYPNNFAPSHLISQLLGQYGDTPADELERLHPAVAIAGRLMAKSKAANTGLGLLQDRSGRMSFLVSDEATGKSNHAAYAGWGAGDIIGLTGMVCRLPGGELAVRAHEIDRLVKALRPLPQAAGPGYLQLLTDQGRRSVFEIRSRVIGGIRAYLGGTAYLEMETPILQSAPERGMAQFETHHNALGRELYLRSSGEVYLKQLLVGGVEKVYEINRYFTNGQPGADYCPEGTKLEIYCAFSSYLYMMALLQLLLGRVTKHAIGHGAVSWQGEALDLSGGFPSITAVDAIRAHAGEPWTNAQLHEVGFLSGRLRERGVPVTGREDWSALQRLLFDAVAAKRLIHPTYVVDFPTRTAPRVRPKDGTPGIAEQFELYIGGQKIAEGRSEINDADQVAEHYGAELVRAVEYGMPPSSGLTLWIDRLVMVLTGSPSIRDVVLFPSNADR